MASAKYDKNDVVTLSWLEQLRLRPGMYIGEIGDGSGYHDCIYVLLNELVANSGENGYAWKRYSEIVSPELEHIAPQTPTDGHPVANGYGDYNDVSDHENGIVSGHWLDSIGNHLILPKSHNCKIGNIPLSSHCFARTVRTGEYGQIIFERGNLVSNECGKCCEDENNGFLFNWIPDSTVIAGLSVKEEHVVNRIKKCAGANPGMSFILNGDLVRA